MKNLLVLAGLLATMTIAALAAYSLLREPWYRRDLNEAGMLLARGEDDKALELLERVAAYDEAVPERATASFLSGEIYLSRNQTEKAYLNFQRAWNETRDEKEKFLCGLRIAALLYEQGLFDDLKKVLDSFSEMRQYLGFISYYRQILYAARAGPSFSFFAQHPEFGVDAADLNAPAFTADDFAFWRNLRLYSSVAGRAAGDAETTNKAAARIADWLNLNVITLGEDEEKGFASDPFHCIVAGHGSLTERAWAACALAQAVGMGATVAFVGAKSAPVVVISGGSGSLLYDVKSGLPLLAEGGARAVTLEELLGEKAPALDAGVAAYEYTAEDFRKAVYAFFVDPHQVLLRSCFFEDRVLSPFATRMLAPVYVDALGQMGRFVVQFWKPGESKFDYPWRSADGAEVRLWAEPFESAAESRLAQRLREKKGGLSEEERAKAERRVSYDEKMGKRFEMLFEARKAMLDGRYEEALKELEALIARKPVGGEEAAVEDAKFFAGLCLYEMKKYEEAAGKLNAYGAGEWKDAALYVRGLSLAALERREEAAEAFGQVEGPLRALAQYHSRG